MKKYNFLIFFFLLFFCCIPINVWAEEDDIESDIGKNVKLGAVTVSVRSISFYKEKNHLMVERLEQLYENVPQNFYAVDLLIFNTSKDNYEYNPYQFVFIDEEDNEYQWCISTKEPKFEGKILKPGMMGKGFLVFAVPKTVKPTHVVFDPGYLYDGRVKFTIKNVSVDSTADKKLEKK